MTTQQNVITPRIPDGHLDTREAISVVIMAVTMKAFLVFPERMARGGQTAGWLLPVASALLSAIWIVPLVRVLSAHPGCNLIDVTKKLCGKPVGFVLGLGYFALSVGLCAPCAYQTGQILSLAVLPKTPLVFLLILGFAVSLYIASLGTEVLGRLSFVGVVLMIGSVSLLFLLSAPYWNTGVFKPWLGPGLGQLLRNAIIRQAVYSEILIIGLIAPYLRVTEHTPRAAFWGIGIAAMTLFVVVTTSQMVLSYPRLLTQTAPFLRVARGIFLGRFLQRLDVLFLLVWLGVATIRTALGIYAGSIALASALGLRTYRLVLPFTALVMVIGALLMPSLSLAVIIDFDLVRPYSVPLLVGWPWMLLIANWFWQKHHRRKRTA